MELKEYVYTLKFPEEIQEFSLQEILKKWIDGFESENVYPSDGSVFIIRKNSKDYRLKVYKEHEFRKQTSKIGSYDYAFVFSHFIDEKLMKELTEEEKSRLANRDKVTASADNEYLIQIPIYFISEGSGKRKILFESIQKLGLPLSVVIKAMQIIIDEIYGEKNVRCSIFPSIKEGSIKKIKEEIQSKLNRGRIKKIEVKYLADMHPFIDSDDEGLLEHISAAIENDKITTDAVYTYSGKDKPGLVADFTHRLLNENEGAVRHKYAFVKFFLKGKDRWDYTQMDVLDLVSEVVKVKVNLPKLEKQASIERVMDCLAKGEYEKMDDR